MQRRRGAQVGRRRRESLPTWIWLAGALCVTAAAAPPAQRDWPAYGGGPAAIRYSPLAQITRANVKSLRVAWTYDSGEEGGLQTNPIVVGRTLYTTTPLHKTVALDAATGAVRDVFVGGRPVVGHGRCLTVDEGELRREATARQARVLQRAGLTVPQRWPVIDGRVAQVAGAAR